MSVVRRALSLPEHVDNLGAAKSNLLFGGNFSSYVCYLISKDNEKELSKEQGGKEDLKED